MTPGSMPLLKDGMAALLGIIQGNPLLQMRASRDQFPLEEQGRPQHPVRVLEQHWVLHALGEGKALLCQLTCRLQPRLIEIKPPQTHQR